MNCPLETRENAQLLLDYCTRKLEPESVAALERHIAICGACREFASGQRAVWQALDAWEAAPVSADFDSRLYRRIETEVSWWDLLLRPFRPVTLRRSLPATAMACLLVMVGVILERPTVSPAPPPGEGDPGGFGAAGTGGACVGCHGDPERVQPSRAHGHAPFETLAMKRHSQVVGVLLLMAAVATCAQSTAEPKPAKAPKAPPPPRNETSA